VNVTEQLARPPLPVGTQEVAENEPCPADDHVMVPPGVVAVPTSVSVTVAVHWAGEPTVTDESHCTEVAVCRRVAVTVVDEALPRCAEFPA